MRVGVIDHHSGDHGGWTVTALEQRWSGQIIEYKVGSERASFDRLAALLNEAADDASKLVAVNLSYGGGSTQSPYGAPSSIDQAVRRLFGLGVTVTLSAGNDGTNAEGVSVMAAHPLIWCIGALDDEGSFADYSQHHPTVTTLFANGRLRSENDGIVRGTSFAAPRVCGAVASLRTRLECTDLNARATIKDNAGGVRFDDADYGGDGTRQYSYFVLPDTLADVTAVPTHENMTDRLRVLSLYQALAGRTPSETELGSDILQLQDGATLAQLARGMRDRGDWLQNQVPVVDRVQALYHLLFERDPSPKEVLKHVKELAPIVGSVTAEVPASTWKDWVSGFMEKHAGESELTGVFNG